VLEGAIKNARADGEKAPEAEGAAVFLLGGTLAGKSDVGALSLVGTYVLDRRSDVGRAVEILTESVSKGVVDKDGRDYTASLAEAVALAKEAASFLSALVAGVEAKAKAAATPKG